MFGWPDICGSFVFVVYNCGRDLALAHANVLQGVYANFTFALSSV